MSDTSPMEKEVSDTELKPCPFCGLHPTDNNKGSFKKPDYSPMFVLRHWCGDKAREITIALSTAERVAEVWNSRASATPNPNLGSDQPWPLRDVLMRLAEAAEHLGGVHNCDCHGWEEAQGCISLARQYAGSLVTPQPANTQDWRPFPSVLPEWDKDRAHKGDTVSVEMEVKGANGQVERGKFHFPTNEWCWRNSTWEVTYWRPVTTPLDVEAAVKQLSDRWRLDHRPDLLADIAAALSTARQQGAEGQFRAGIEAAAQIAKDFHLMSCADFEAKYNVTNEQELWEILEARWKPERI